ETLISMSGPEGLRIPVELVRPEPHQRRTNDPQAAQQAQPGGQLVAPDAAHGPDRDTVIETTFVPALLPRGAGKPAQVIQDRPHTLPVPSPVVLPHLGDNRKNAVHRGVIEVSPRARRHFGACGCRLERWRVEPASN